MTHDEMASEISIKCRETMDKYRNSELSEDAVFNMLKIAAIHGFELGSRTALAMVHGALITQQIRGIK